MKQKRKHTRSVLSAAVSAAALSLSAYSGSALAVDPYAKPDDSWISISGTVVAPTSDAFTLDYGKGVITVEMDDWDSYGEAYTLLDGDKVTVYGAIDDDLFEVASIEAGAVYVDNLNTHFYASSADEEGIEASPIPLWHIYYVQPVPKQVAVSGTVSSVNKVEREFTIDTGLSKVTVDTSEMAYNPLDDLGYQQIDRGDRVSVTGNIDYEFFDGRVLDAETVVTLQDDGRDA